MAIVLDSLEKYKKECGKKFCTFKELNTRFGFKFSRKQRTTARNWMCTTAYFRQVQPEDTVPPDMPEQPRHGRPPSPHKEAIRRFFYRDDISHPAANRTRLVDGEHIAARYLEEPVNKTFLKWQEDETTPKISLSTFYKYKPAEVLKPHRETDLCNICEEGRRLEALVAGEEALITAMDNGSALMHREESEELNDSFEYPDSLDYDSSSGDYDSDNCDNERTSPNGYSEERRANAVAAVKEARKSLELVDIHQKLQKTISGQYKEDVAALQGQPKATVMVMDFKQNMPLNLAGRQDSTHFFSQAACSVLNLSVHYYCPAADKIKLKHFDFFSSCLSHDTQYVRDSLYHVLYENDWFKSMGFNSGVLYLETMAQATSALTR